MSKDTIVVTIDVDWAPTRVLHDTVSLLNEYEVAATVFSTHNDGVELDNHERALHPNFRTDDRDERAILSELTNLFPEAIGVRSHGLYTHSELRSLYTEFGLVYESNFIRYRRPDIEPFLMRNQDIYQMPIYFGDYPWMREGADRIDAVTLLDEPGLKMLYFHPIHVFLNTPTIPWYESRKQFYQDPERLEQERYSGWGIRELFCDVLEYANEETETATIAQVLESGV